MREERDREEGRDERYRRGKMGMHKNSPKIQCIWHLKTCIFIGISPLRVTAPCHTFLENSPEQNLPRRQYASILNRLKVRELHTSNGSRKSRHNSATYLELRRMPLKVKWLLETQKLTHSPFWSGIATKIGENTSRSQLYYHAKFHADRLHHCRYICPRTDR